MYDTMTDEFDQKYAVWPERYYILKGNKLDYIFEPTVDFGFDRDEMERQLNVRLNSIQKLEVFVHNVI